MSKAWTEAAIRDLARQTVDGRQQTLAARGLYFRALVETAQAELGGKAGQDGQRAAIRTVHRRFYPVVQKAIATDELIAAAGFARKEIALERNRRLNFARSAHGTIQRWLRADGHDLIKLDSQKVTKSQLLKEAPPTRAHALTPKRIKAGASKRVDALLDYTRQIAKADPEQAKDVITAAIDKLIQLTARLGAEKGRATTDAGIAAKEMRPLRVGNRAFWHVDLPIAK